MTEPVDRDPATSAPGREDVAPALTNLGATVDDLGREIGALESRLGTAITRREEAEMRLRASEQRQRDFAECAADWFWETGPDLRFTYFSEGAAQMLGRPSEDLIGKGFRALTGREQIAAEPEKWRVHFEQIAYRRAFQSLEVPVPRDGERTVYLQLSGKPFLGPSGEFAGYRGAARDVSVVREAQALLESQSTVDDLTGVANRRRLDDFVEHEWHTAERTVAPLALILVDVDFFKRYNDRYGHSAGDDCLRRVATTLAAGLRRKIDLAARYGGEEFACVLPGTELAGAVAVAKRLCSDVAALGIPHEDSETAAHVTISLGVAAAVPSADAEPVSLVEAADERLYVAKRAGRNRVCGGEQERTVVSIDRSTP